jgi:8-oxo-dGTP pyrophosphatase MutT (NUDIX family)
LTSEPNFISEVIVPESKPYRKRVELFARDSKGNLLGGFYPSKGGFGTFGGGVDPGEDLQEAAAREFQEESGYKIKNVRPVPVTPLMEVWKAPEKGSDAVSIAKFKERIKEFKGSKTHFFVGDLHGKKGKKDVDDATYPFKDVRFRSLSNVIDKHEKELEKAKDPAVAKRLERRLSVLEFLHKEAATRWVRDIAQNRDDIVRAVIRRSPTINQDAQILKDLEQERRDKTKMRSKTAYDIGYLQALDELGFEKVSVAGVDKLVAKGNKMFSMAKKPVAVRPPGSKEIYRPAVKPNPGTAKPRSPDAPKEPFVQGTKDAPKSPVAVRPPGSKEIYRPASKK